MKYAFPLCLSAALFFGLGSSLQVFEGTSSPPREDSVSVQLADGFTMSLWAADTMVANPVAISFDEEGRAFVTQTNRRRTSVLDIRRHPNWMTEDQSFETVEDKRAFLKRVLTPERSDEHDFLEDLNDDGFRDWRDLAVETEKVYVLADTDGDGRADRAHVFAEGFDTEVTGVAAGVLPYGDDVYLTVAPNLWRLQDTDGDGVSDERESISYGYGNHFGFGGHDMSGLTMGPDGKIYWTIGDIGVNVEGPDGRRWFYPHHGAVMRSNPDGSDFEVFARGLRNPQEIAFDAYGNLFTVDNDGDHPGEHERVVYLVEGSDSGWRINWQYGKYSDPRNSPYNVWMEEQLHVPHFEGQAAYITPPVAPADDGPAGFVFNPGTALSDRWEEFFFTSYFKGSPSRSHVSAFRMEPEGASFRVEETQEILRGIQTTGLDFSPDGALYLADWIEGWDKNDRGRIWKLDVPGAPSPERIETRRLLAADFSERAVAALAELLHHEDMRVRMKAQFSLVKRGAAGQRALLAAARQREHRLARLHGIWGLGMLARERPQEARPLVALLRDEDPEIRAQAAEAIGEARYEPAADALLRLLRDEHARPRFFAAEALGKMGERRAIDPLIDLVEADGGDPFLRFVGAAALARIGEAEPILTLTDHPSRAVRLAAVVALRRMQHPGVARFLEDEDEDVVTEAARAIHDDLSIEEGLPALAALLDRRDLRSEPLLRRAINANLRLGTQEAARRLARHAVRSDVPTEMRAEALGALSVWPAPPPLDRVEGRYRPLGERDARVAQRALSPVLEQALGAGPDTVRFAAAEAVGRLHYTEGGPQLIRLLTDEQQPVEVRYMALHALGEMQHPLLPGALEVALEDESKRVRVEAQRLMALLDLPAKDVVEMLGTVLERGSLEEQQSAFASLGELQTAEAHALLAAWMDRLLAGDLPPELRLDLVEAVEATGSAALAERLEAYRAAQPDDDPLAEYADLLTGGDPASGRRLVYRHPTAQCMRCHAIGGAGGQVGPDLTDIGSRLDRRALLESLVAPSARLAPGYGTVMLTLESGRSISGTLVDETEDFLTVQTGSGEPVEVPKDEVAERMNVPSGMPPMHGILSNSEIRDVVAFLAGLE